MRNVLSHTPLLGQAAARGETPAPPSREPALDASNKGFQMLQSAGWCEGTGLGAGSQGVVAPVSVAPASGNGQGVGTTETHAVTQDDDEFDQYRKRMMLAYRFRPNPLNSACRTCVVLCLIYPQSRTRARALISHNGPFALQNTCQDPRRTYCEFFGRAARSHRWALTGTRTAHRLTDAGGLIRRSRRGRRFRTLPRVRPRCTETL